MLTLHSCPQGSLPLTEAATALHVPFKKDASLCPNFRHTQTHAKCPKPVFILLSFSDISIQ